MLDDARHVLVQCVSTEAARQDILRNKARVLTQFDFSVWREKGISEIQLVRLINCAMVAADDWVRQNAA